MTALKPRSAIFIRLDKIGDLVSTLPCDENPGLKDYDITWAIASGLRFIPEHSLPPRKYFELNKAHTWKSFWQLFRFLKKQKPELAVSFQAPWWISFGLWLAGVPNRVGRRSQWHSFLFFNKGLRQQRSQSQKHEADYNMDLVQKALNASPMAAPVLRLKANRDQKLLEKFHLSEKKFFVVHPGMAGSALNWPVKNYLELIKNLLEQNHTVAVTGTAGDEAWLGEIKKTFQGHPHFRNLQNQVSASELLSLLSSAQAVLAPSTGVLHLAAALGTKSVGIYSPVLSQRSTRWKARGPQVKILEPQVTCPATHSCWREKCPLYLCLEQVTVQQINEALLEI